MQVVIYTRFLQPIEIIELPDMVGRRLGEGYRVRIVGQMPIPPIPRTKEELERQLNRQMDVIEIWGELIRSERFNAECLLVFSDNDDKLIQMLQPTRTQSRQERIRVVEKKISSFLQGIGDV